MGLSEDELSKTTLMTCPLRAVPNSFKARSDRAAEPGGIISDPGNPDFLKVASRVLAELVDEDSEAPRRVTEAASDLGTGGPLNEEGAAGLVLAVGGVGGFEEDLGKVR